MTSFAHLAVQHSVAPTRGCGGCFHLSLRSTEIAGASSRRNSRNSTTSKSFCRCGVKSKPGRIGTLNCQSLRCSGNYKGGHSCLVLNDLSFHCSVFFCFTIFSQWFPVDSGTTNNLNRAYLSDSGTGFIVRDMGSILKTTDLGATWTSLLSGTTRGLQHVLGQKQQMQRS